MKKVWNVFWTAWLVTFLGVVTPVNIGLITSKVLERRPAVASVKDSDLYAIYKASQAAVVVFASNGGFGSGSTIITPYSDYVITAAHVVEECKSLDKDGNTVYDNVIIGRVIYTADNKIDTKDTCNAKVVRISHSTEGHDIALLRLAKKGFARGSLEFYEQYTYPGQRVIACSSPHNPKLAYTISEGIISGVVRHVEAHKKEMIQSSVTTAPGSSGCAVLDRQSGKIVGILTRGIDNSLVFLVPVFRIHEWAVEAKVEFIFDPKEAPEDDEVDKGPVEVN